MGTTFIKLGQFLATRPDIIGEEMAKDLENFKIKFLHLSFMTKSTKKEIGENNTKNN